MTDRHTATPRTHDDDGACVLECPPFGDPRPCPCTPGVTDRLRLDQHTDDTLTELYDQIDHAKADIALCRAQKWPERLARAEAERDQHAAAVDAVRQLHHPAECVNVRCAEKQWCIGCDPGGDDGCAENPWPCPTIRALDTALAGPPQPDAARAATEGSAT